MKKIFLTVILILTAVLIMPCVCANAEEVTLDDVPMFNEDFFYGGSKKAYICQIYDESAGIYTLTYYNSKTSKLLYKSADRFDYNVSISEDGTTAFYSINDSVYRYSYTEGKKKKIYTVPAGEYRDLSKISVYSSPDGEYCMFSYSYYTTDNRKEVFFKLWHDGKVVSDKVYDGYDSIFSISVTNDGKAIYMNPDNDDDKLYSFSFDTGKKELFASASSENNEYKTQIYHDKKTYVMYGLKKTGFDDPDYYNYRAIYSGKLYEEPKLIYSETIEPKNVIACNGEAIVLYDGEYVVRIDLESGKSKNIVKLSSKLLKKHNLSDHFLCSDDLDSVVYISQNKLVRLFGWNSKKNSYTKREEIDLNGKKSGILDCSSDDLSIVEVIFKELDKSNNQYDSKSYAAFFEEGKLIPAPNNIFRIDRFGHVICRDSSEHVILSSDGSVKKVFEDGWSVLDHDISSGYYIFVIVEDWDIEPADYFDYYEVNYLADYYINENGDAVLIRYRIDKGGVIEEWE